MSLDPKRFRATMGQLAAGVTVVTVQDGAKSLGTTVTAASALSLEPPMLLVCVDRRAAIHDLLVRAPQFGVNILSEAQEELARRFADPRRHEFSAEIDPAGPHGLFIAGALAQLACERTAVYAGGDHSIVTATVVSSRLEDGGPLLHFRSAYARLAP